MMLLIFFLHCKKDEVEIKFHKNDPGAKPFVYVNSVTKLTSGLLVRSTGGLKLRDQPDLNGKTVTVIPDGSFVEFIEDSGVEIEAEGKKGNFFKIRFEDKEGYSFSGLIDFSKEEDKIFGYREINRTEGSKFYFRTFTSEKDKASDFQNCNRKYSDLNCFYIVYNDKNVPVAESGKTRDYTWTEWSDEHLIELDASFGDGGCDLTKKAKFNVYKKSIVDEISKTECIKMD